MGRLPSWWKGKKIRCDISGEEHYELDGTMLKQRGLNVTRKFFDTLTEEQRQNSIKRR